MNLLFNIIVGIFAVIGLVVTVSIVTYEIKEKRKQKDIRNQLELLRKLNDGIKEGLQEVLKQQEQENEDN